MTPQDKASYDILVGHYLDAYRQYWYWRTLRAPISRNVSFARNRTFWNFAFNNFAKLFSLELAKLLEKPNPRDRRPISIYSVEPIRAAQALDPFQDKIEIVMKLRKRFLAHQDEKIAMDYKKFFAELGLNIDDIDLLFDKIKEILESARGDYGLSGSIDRTVEIRTQCDREVRDIMSILGGNVEFIEHIDPT